VPPKARLLNQERIAARGADPLRRVTGGRIVRKTVLAAFAFALEAVQRPARPAGKTSNRRSVTPRDNQSQDPHLSFGKEASAKSVDSGKMGEPSQPGFFLSRARDDLPRRRLLLVLLGMLGLGLLWLILSRNLVAYLAVVTPEEALLLRPGDPAALVNLAEGELNFTENSKAEKRPPLETAHGRLGVLRRIVEEALARDPLNARAYRLLGQVAEAERDGPRARQLMEAAVRHSLNETYAVQWMMHKCFQDKDYVAAAFYADILLRSRPQLMDYALPILGGMAGIKKAFGEMEKLLARNPPWRAQFLQTFGGAVTDARIPLAMFLALKDTAAPPTLSDLSAYLSLLFQNKMYDLAYYTWLQFLPPGQLESAGLLFNGSFDTKPSGLPFDWVMPTGSSVIVDIVPRPDAKGRNALFLEFGQGRADFPGVFETTMLPPGAYKFKGSFKGELAGPRGLQWSVSCLEGAVIGESQMITGSISAWEGFEFPFAVPESGCRAQSARLALAARSAYEQIVSGSIWFDDLSIARLGEFSN
jgi:hypothetical protein